MREICAILDLSWVHVELAPYCPKIGHPSIETGAHDPDAHHPSSSQIAIKPVSMRGRPLSQRLWERASDRKSKDAVAKWL
jgi:hypothetical protein